MNHSTRLLLYMLALLLAGCASLQVPSCPPQRVSPDAARELADFHSGFQDTAVYSARLDIFWHTISMMLIVKPGKDSLKAYATTLNGVTIYSVDCTRDKPPAIMVSDAVPERGRKAIFDTLHQDLINIFCLPEQLPQGDTLPLADERDGITTLYAFSPLAPCFRRCGTFPGRKWQAAYEQWNPQSHSFSTIRYKNFDRHFTLTLLHP